MLVIHTGISTYYYATTCSVFYMRQHNNIYRKMGYTGKLIQITTVANELRIPMYLIIDEFDNFTNQTYKRLKKEKIYKDYLLLSQIILIFA